MSATGKVVSERLNSIAIACSCSVDEAIGPEDDRQRVAGEGRSGKDIDDDVVEDRLEWTTDMTAQSIGRRRVKRRARHGWPARNGSLRAVSVAPTRVFIARLAGLFVYDPNGDQVGKVRDVVVAMRSDNKPPRVLGLVVEVLGRRRIFVPMTRVTSVDSGQVITTGLVNMRRFEQRSTETLVIGELLDRTVTIPDSDITGTVFDIAMEETRTRDWVLSRIAVQYGSKRFGRRGQSKVVEWYEVSGLHAPEVGQGATHLLAAFEEMRPADLANAMHALSPKRGSRSRPLSTTSGWPTSSKNCPKTTRSRS